MFSFEYLQRTFVEFRGKMGDRTIMLDRDRREHYLGALFYATNNTTLTPAESEVVQQWWMATFEEFTRRAALVDLYLIGRSA